MNSRVSFGLAAAMVALLAACGSNSPASGTGGGSQRNGGDGPARPDGSAGGMGGLGRDGGGAGAAQPLADASQSAPVDASDGAGDDVANPFGKDAAADATPADATLGDAKLADAGPVDGAEGNGGASHPRRVLVCDEGNRKVTLLDLQDSARAIWSTLLNDPTKDGDGMRDMQLVGGDRVAVSTAKGYVELTLGTGARAKQVSSFSGVESLRRLPNGNTVLGSNSNGGVTLQELDNQDAPVAGHKVTFTNLAQFRMLRRTPEGTFLLGVGNKLAEVDWDKKTLWEMDFPAAAGHDLNYMYQGLRLPDTTIAVTSGYAASILIVDPKTKTVKQTLGGKSQPDAATIVPNFYGGFQLLPNGHFVVTNWEGHGAGNGNTGVQLLEYDARGVVVWKWKQSATLVSSLHNVIVLDGLDTTKLHDDVNGVLAPVTQ